MKTDVVTDSENPTAGSSQDRSATAEEDQQLVRQLAKLWQSFCRRGMEVRHKIGTQLNKRLGPPTVRQAHGEAVLKKAAEEMGVSECELSRMRWLAHLFPDLKKLSGDHPKCGNWTQFKELLPGLKSGKHATNDQVQKTRFRRLIRSFKAVPEKIESLGQAPDEELDLEIRTTLETIRATITKYLEEHPQIAVS